MKISVLALAAGLVLAAGGAAPAAAPRSLPAPPTRLLAYDWQAQALMRVDPLTLRRHGALVRTGNPVWHAFSPDGGRLVLAPDFGRLELVDVRRGRFLGRFPSLGRSTWVDGLLWADPGRVVALVRGASPRAVAVDVAVRRVVSDVPIAGAVAATAQGRTALAVLTGPRAGIGPSRLHVVDARGRVRTAGLARVRSGAEALRGTASGARQLSPGVALDPAGRRAVVIQPAGPATEVDLTTMRVAYHELRTARSLAARLHDWLEPQAHAKPVVGPELWAHWIGEDAVAVASWEHAGIGRRGGEHRAIVRAHGVFLVDVREWTRRTLSETASGLEAAGDTALVYAGAFAAGRPFGADEGRPPRGLDAHDPGGRRRFRLFGRRVVGGVQAVGAYAYVRVGERSFDVVDVRAGRVLARARTPHDLTLLDTG